MQTRIFAVDREETYLAEVEQPLVEPGPDAHASALHVMGQVVDVELPGAGGMRIDLAQPREALIRHAARCAVAIDEVDQGTTDALDGGHVEGQAIARRLRTQADRAVECRARVGHAPAHAWCAGTVRRDKPGGVAAGLLVDQVVDVTLAVERHGARAMPGDSGEAHSAEQRVQLARIGMRELDEGKAVEAGRILRRDGCRCGVVGKRTHGHCSFEEASFARGRRMFGANFAGASDGLHEGRALDWQRAKEFHPGRIRPAPAGGAATGRTTLRAGFGRACGLIGVAVFAAAVPAGVDRPHCQLSCPARCEPARFRCYRVRAGHAGTSLAGQREALPSTGRTHHCHSAVPMQ